MAVKSSMIAFRNGSTSSSASSSSSSSSQNGDPVAFIDSILVSNGQGLSTEERRKKTRKLMGILREHRKISTLSSDLSTRAVVALKTLGRTPEGTEDLASEEGIKLLLELAGFEEKTSSSGSFLVEPLSPAISEAVRCLANVCLLHEPARVRLATIPGVPEAILKSGENSTDLMTRFLSSRLLFLITVSGGSVTATLVEDLSLASYLSRRLLEYMAELCDNGALRPDQQLKSDILAEYLKVSFNVTLFYPRVAAERKANTSSNSNSLSPAAKHARSSSKSKGSGTSSKSSSPKAGCRSVSPAQQMMQRSSSASSDGSQQAAMLPNTAGAHGAHLSSSNVSVAGTSTTATNRPKSPNMSRTTTEKIKGMFSRRSKEEERPDIFAEDSDVLRPWGFDEVVAALVQLALCLPYGTGPDYGPFGLHKHVISALLNYNFTSYTSDIFAPLSPALAADIPPLPSTSATKASPSLAPVPARLLTLLDGCCRVYIPGTSGPDDDDAREAALSAPAVLDEGLQVLLLLLTKCMTEDPSGDVRRAFKQCLLAEDMDRSVAPEKRSDLTGRLIRLMNSTYLSGSAEAVARFLFVVCDQNPSALIRAIGYGNASGFLQSMNMLLPPGTASSDPDASSSEEASQYRSVNPITGAYDSPNTSGPEDMTDEEKEREAEKLFVLFERMNRTGAMSVVNPVKDAKDAGRLSTTAEEEELERKRLQQEEDDNEREALAEMQRYRERKNRPPA